MTCADVRPCLDDWPALAHDPAWGAVVRHTWDCAACRSELVVVMALAERVRLALEALPPPPAALRRSVLRAEETANQKPSLQARLAELRPYVPPILRLVLVALRP